MALKRRKIFELLIFDLDGTLVDSQADLADSVNYVLKSYGRRKISIPTLRSFIGNGVVNLMERAMPDLKGKALSEAVATFRSHYNDHLLDKTRPYPGIKQLLQNARGIKKAVLTNKTESFARKILEGSGLAGHFPVIWGGDTGKARKPCPEPVLAVISRLKAEPGNTILIGDSENDVLSARAAGAFSGAVAYGYSSKKELLELKPDYFFKKPSDIAKLL